MTSLPTYYEILGLPERLQNESTISAQTLRSAYRRALLQNHPDKSLPSTVPALTQKESVYTIDQISEARDILSDPKSRAKYDKELKLQSDVENVRGIHGKAFRTGQETVDLDDLKFDEAQGAWYRSCRCGDERGFLVREEDLEEALDDGELNVGCRGCSLWLKVLFGVIEEDAQDTTEATDKLGYKNEER